MEVKHNKECLPVHFEYLFCKKKKNHLKSEPLRGCRDDLGSGVPAAQTGDPGLEPRALT